MSRRNTRVMMLAMLAFLAACDSPFESPLERSRRNQPAEMDVEYDDSYHFPRSISLDPIKNAIDDEVVYKVEGFTPLSGR